MSASETTASQESPVICRNIHKRFGGAFGGLKVLDDVSFSIPKGAVLGLIGRNGAGKTTLMRILVGLLMPESGSAMVLGEPAAYLTDAAKTRLGYVPQEPQSLSWMTVQAMLQFVGSFYPNWDHDYMWNSLMRWEIPPSQRLAKLSPGQRQRVALIRVLAACPELLVLDEPASALDPVARRDFLREIALRAGEAGTTVLFSTHIVSDLERVASHVCFLHEGKLLLDTPMDDLKETHARLSLSREAAAALSGRLPGELARRRRPDGGMSIVLTRKDIGAWPGAATTSGGTLEAMSLEDLFIEVTDHPGAPWFRK
ncbi:MAG TPA: ABC transporter ATP-binding protein [Steroidobacteraceae bacterium]|nr:ABC transporter ATP-binding protein [Steroidobacteraceae bacterium]